MAALRVQRAPALTVLSFLIAQVKAMHEDHLSLIIGFAVALAVLAFGLYLVRKHLASKPRDTAYPDACQVLGPEWAMRQEASRAMIEILSETALELISKKVREGGDSQEPIHIAITFIDVTIRTGHLDVLDSTLARVDPTWPSEVVIAFWKGTAPVQDKLPSRAAMWKRFEHQEHC